MMLLVDDLWTWIEDIPILRGVSLEVGTGETVGIVGESGAGKSMLARSILGLLPEGGAMQGKIALDGEDLISLDDRQLARIRGSRLALVLQDAQSALDPLMTVGRQLALPLKRRGVRGEMLKSESVRLLKQVRIDRPESRLRAYPHQLSGGQRQRVMLAVAIARRPDVLIADEPTTALDVTIKAEILTVLRDLVDNGSMSLMMITHDLPVVSFLCERVVVMYGGKIVETGPTRAVFGAPKHPYTSALVESMPVLQSGTWEDGDLPTIPGSVPPAGGFPGGCPFRTRCSYAQEMCKEEPPLELMGNDRSVSCWFPLERRDVEA